MDNINDKQHLKPFLEPRKRKSGPSMNQEELQSVQGTNPCIKRFRAQLEQQMPPQTSWDGKKAKEDQLESYILHLETKNKSLLAKVTDLSSLNKKLYEENIELHSQQEQTANTTSYVQESIPQVPTEVKTDIDELQYSLEVLDTQALMALWEEVSSIPLPQCTCSKSKSLIKTGNLKTKKYKAYNA